MRVIGLDIHRAFAEAVALEDGKLKRLGRVTMWRDLLEKFAASLSKDDIIVVEATGNAAAVAAVIGPHAKRVVIANPKQVRMIAHAKIKTDTIDAGVLAQLYASGFLPEVWIADEATQALRRQVTRRNQIVRQRSRLKNIIQSILHAHLIPSCPHQNLCGPMGRVWLAKQAVPEDERLAIERHLREFDRLGEDLKVVERDLARSALADESIKRLMTIPGIHMIVALAIKAAVGDVKRFPRPQKLVSYLGLNPSIRQFRAGAGLPWADHEARPRTCPRHAGRGGLGSSANAWPFAGLFPSCAGQAGPACGGCRDGAQAGYPDLASAYQE
jgi:transposase